MSADEPDLLTFVFTFHVVDRILNADGKLHALEIDWLVDRFPRESLAERGLIDDNDALTARYEELLELALVELPDQLSEERKASLIQTFFESALADGEFEPREAKMITYACDRLGIPANRVYDALPDVELELDD